MSFIDPQVLWFLVLAPVLAGAYVLLQRRRKAYAVRFTNLDLLASVAPKRPGWRKHVAPLLMLMTFIVLIAAAARPQRTVQVAREQASIMLVMDVSRSMLATDLEPDRMTAAKRAAVDFVDALPKQMRVGLVSFSDLAYLIQPLTVDHRAVKESLGSLETQAGTAMGDGLAQALNQIESRRMSGDRAPASILVLSDGETNLGLPPGLAAEASREAGVTIYSIGVGTDNGVVEVGGRAVPVQLNETDLRAVAETTNGRYFKSASTASLDGIYQSLGSSLGYREETREITPLVAGLGAALLVLAAMLSLLWFQRIP